MAERQPTSHERAAGAPWDSSYTHGPAPWDIAGPQPAVARLAAGGVFIGSVLDAGCGTGDNTVHIAATGADILGIDVAPTAIARAQQVTAELDLGADFTVADALALDRLGARFDTVLDSALFHTFDAAERAVYVAGLAAVTAPGAMLFLLCFSDVGAASELGPHPVSRAELEAAFGSASGWKILELGPERLRTRMHADPGASAWLARIARV